MKLWVLGAGEFSFSIRVKKRECFAAAEIPAKPFLSKPCGAGTLLEDVSKSPYPYLLPSQTGWELHEGLFTTQPALVLPHRFIQDRK